MMYINFARAWSRLYTLFFIFVGNLLWAQESEYYFFTPNYQLPGKAGNTPGNKMEDPVSRHGQFHIPTEIPEFHGKRCTDHKSEFIKEPLSIPFSIEIAILHHFNKPVVSFNLMGQNERALALSYYSEKDRGEAEISIYDFIENKSLSKKTVKNHYQKYWQHLLLTYEYEVISVYQNGEKLFEVPIVKKENIYDLSIAAYLSDEPFATINNLVKYVAIYRGNPDEIDPGVLFESFKNQVESGVVYPQHLHFNAGPYLHYATESGINLTWETNTPTSAVIEYGEELPLNQSIKINNAIDGDSFIYEATIGGLKAGQKYFYNLKVSDAKGNKMESGILSFKTAETSSNPILFGLIGDTETRPHINNQVSKKLWAERPDFVIILGDLTDGGMKEAKWQWNLEYFTGMTQLFSRVPVFPVPGNGEGDLYWYKKYHVLPEEEAYYSFKYGEAEFFMLNSNERKNEFKPGGAQYDWLDKSLGQSSAKWKFVAMHHAPYSTDEDDYGDTYRGKSTLGDEHVRSLTPVFEKHHVDAVFYGHLHSYNRIGPLNNGHFDQVNGIWYIQSGGAGGNIEDFDPVHHWMSRKSYAGHHYCTVSITSNEMILTTYDLEGSIIDINTIKK